MDKNKKNNSKKTGFTEAAVMACLGFIIAIIPIIVGLKTVRVTPDEYGSIRSSMTGTDVFIYYKRWALIAAVLVMLFFLISDYITAYKKKSLSTLKNPAVICCGVYGVIAVLSAVFSKYKYVAFGGVTERYEGLIVLLCYISLFLVGMYFVRNIKRLNFVVVCIMLSALLVGLIGAGQFFGYDIFKTEAAARMIFGSSYSSGSTLTVKYDRVYSTLYNPNCVGSFFALMLPFFGVMAFALPPKNKFKYVSLGLGVICAVNIVGSGSVGGLLGVFVSIALSAAAGLVYAIRKGVFRKLSSTAAIGFVIAVVVLGAAAAGLFSADGIILRKAGTIFDALTGKQVQSSPYFWRDLSVRGDLGVITVPDYEITVGLDENGEPVVTEKDVVLKNTGVSEENGVVIYTYNIKNMQSAKVMLSDDIIYFEGFDGINTVDFMFRPTDNGMTAVDRNGRDYDLDTEVRHMGFEGYEYLGSSRGYIWSRSLPLVFKPKTFLIGSGPDTFALGFPQTDLRGKTRFLGNPYVIVDKPHNQYLQIAINTGVLSLGAFVALVLIYLFSTVKTVFAEKDPVLNALRAAFAAGITAYLVTALTTDSTVAVAPIFWIMLGVGCGLSQKGFRE